MWCIILNFVVKNNNYLQINASRKYFHKYIVMNMSVGCFNSVYYQYSYRIKRIICMELQSRD